MLDAKDLKAIGELFDNRIQRTETKLTERLDGVDARLDGVDARLDKVDACLDKVDVRLDKVDARLDKIDARLDGVDVRLDGVDARLDGLDKRLDDVDKKIDDVETKLTERIDGVEEKLTERIDRVEKKQESSEKFLTDVIANVDANSLKHIDTEIARLDKKLDRMDQWFRIAQLESSNAHDILNLLMNHQQRIETLETKMA